MLLCNALWLEQKPRTLGITKFSNDITITLWISAKWNDKSIRNCNVYKNTNKYILITHFLILNITNIFVLIIYITSVSKEPWVCFFFIKQYKSHFFILWVANLVIGKKFFKNCRLNRVFLMKSKTILVKELPLIYRGTTSKI